jgi:hypothetical protein
LVISRKETANHRDQEKEINHRTQSIVSNGLEKLAMGNGDQRASEATAWAIEMGDPMKEAKRNPPYLRNGQCKSEEKNGNQNRKW